MKPLVSVIIPNYNYAHYLPAAIDSVLGQSYPNLEMIVVDDGSQDDSEEIVKQFGERVRFIKQQNQGVAMARNRGVSVSKGQLIAFLDADDLWLPSKLEKQVQRILDDAEIGLVHCALEEIDSEGKSLRTDISGMDGWVAKEMLLFRQTVIRGSGSCGLVPRETFDLVGGFDSRLSTAADWDFCYRVALRQRVSFVPEPLVKYRIHTSNMHVNIAAMEHDMLLGFDKAFSADDNELSRMRRQCYGNLHMILAGSFFRTGHRVDFARHALKSVWLAPKNVTRLLAFPVRHYQRLRRPLDSTKSFTESISDKA
jgi:glycosyltransferase involved in cell wall biosynthesis